MPQAKTILVVDDDHDIAQAVCLRLRANGFRPIVAKTGAGGIDVACRHRPDAVVLDIRMDDMDGLTVLSSLQARQQTSQIPIVVLSACISSQSAALERGARFFVSKPYRGEELVSAVHKAIEECEASDPQLQHVGAFPAVHT